MVPYTENPAGSVLRGFLCVPVLFSGRNFREEGARAVKVAAKEIVRKDNIN